MLFRLLTSFLCILSICSIFSESADAQQRCVEAAGSLRGITGDVTVRVTGGTPRPAMANENLCPLDVISVGGAGSALIRLANQSVVRLDGNSTLRIVEVAPEAGSQKRTLLDQLKGIAYYFSRQPRSLTVSTPFINAGVEGTEFLVQVEADWATVIVYEGTVVAGNDRGTESVASGAAVVAERGDGPTFVQLVRPRDAVQWALHYPPILLALADASGEAAETVAPPLRGPVRLAAGGRYAAALEAFDRLPAGARDADYFTFRAATLLSVGRVEDARADIDQALREPAPAANAHALRAVIAVAQNDPAQAAADAEQAVRLAPDSAAAHIALSYAEQARFRLGAARQALQRAVELEPDNGLAFARLAEIRLAFGDSRRAVETAEKARLLAPEVARVHTVLGFAYLARFRTADAANAFRWALLVDPMAPLPHFGLGLATIRGGALSAGRADIETAVALDPDNALLRSYLGKAYFEERTINPLTYFNRLISRFTGEGGANLAAEQFAQAKALDPNDPTPWFYDALRLQSENRPVAALRNLENSIELNDNRAVYRSRELLDADRATRGASLARIYNDLGFTQMGINEASKSLALDPGNPGAHRFLSDIRSTQQRVDIAQKSELLRAQLLQDININPVQPSLAAGNVDSRINGFGFRDGLNEYTPLFERNQAQLAVTGLAGTEYTFANEVIASGVYDRFSVSAGQYHFETDGFRKDFDLDEDITNFFAQAAITPEINLQGEVTIQSRENGDRELDFDPNFRDDGREDLDRETIRLGARVSPSVNSDVIASFIYGKFDSKRQLDDSLGVISSTEKEKIDLTSYQGEMQHIYRGENFNIVSGFSIFDVDREQDNREQFFFLGTPFFEIASNTTSRIKDERFYTQGNFEIPFDLLFTAGLGYVDYDDQDLDREDITPSFGLRWQAIEEIAFRAAAVRTVKPALINNRTLQPTQVAGFNRFFDDINGSESWLYGVGMDVAMLETLSFGAEYTRREISSPLAAEGTTDPRLGQTVRTYVYWAPLDQIAFSAEPTYDFFRLDDDASGLPRRVATWTVPVSARFFSETGFFAGVTPIFVYQDVFRRQRNETPAQKRREGDDAFVDLSATIGYRLPERRGIITVEGANLLDSDFSYQDDTYRSADDNAAVSPFIPERSVLVRATLVF